jgi:hypothetical protein
MDHLVDVVWVVLLCLSLTLLSADAIARKTRKHK